MKGIVFTEFLDFVGQQHSADMVDDIIDASDLASGGAYTSVGTYPHSELIDLIAALSSATGSNVPDLIRAFGQYLFGRLISAYPEFQLGMESSFDFLRSVESRIHTEVVKLYPDAELPVLDYRSVGPDELIIDYRSTRPFADLAEGMISGCIAHYKENISVVRETVSPPQENIIQFVLTRRP